MTLRLYIHSPATIFAAQVNQAEFTYPLDEVTYDNVTGGSYPVIKDDATIIFGTSPGGDDLGRQRVRGKTADKIFIGRSSLGTNDGELSLQDNAYITVLKDFRVWAKIPYITEDGTIYKDSGLGVYDQTLYIPPKSNAGTAMAGDIDPSSNTLEVDISGSDSYGVVGAVASYFWDVDDGTITTGTTASENITVTFPAGFRYVSLRVTDVYGETHKTNVPIYARDPNADTTIGAFSIESHTISQSGQRMDLRVIESIPEETYPDGTLIMVWEDNPASAADRSHMRFVGWHHADPARIQAGRTGIVSDTTLECLDVAGKLATLPGFPISVQSDASPSTWLEMAAPTMDKYIDYIFRWHSTAFEVAQFTPSGTEGAYPFVVLGSDAQNLWQQASRRAQSLVPDYVLTCNTKGAISVNPDPMIQSVADRTAVGASMLESQWSAMSYTSQRYPRVHWLRSEAVLASTSVINGIFCVAPGESPGQGESEQTHGEQLAISQTDLNEAEGNRYARLNSRQSTFSISPATFSDIDGFEPADMTWLQLTMSSATAAKRGAPFTTARGLVLEININYRQEKTGLVREASIQWERETNGDGAVTHIPPDTDIDPGYEPPINDGFDTTPTTGFGDGFGTVYVMAGDALIRTRAFSAASPSYSDITPGSAASCNDFVLDPYDPINTGVLLADDGVYMSTDLIDSSPTWTQMLSDTEIETIISPPVGVSIDSAYKIIGSINQEGWFSFTATYPRSSGGAVNGGLWFIYTDDYGDTWSGVEISSVLYADYFSFGAFDIVPHVVSGSFVLYAARSGAGAAGDLNIHLYKSTNNGATWTSVSTQEITGGIGALFVHCPYEGNEDGLTVYWGGGSGNSKEYLYKTSSGSTAGISPAVTGGSGLKRWTGETYTQDNQIMYSWVAPHDLYSSSDGGDSWTQTTTSGISDIVVGSGGFPNDSGLFYAVTDAGDIMVSTDRGENWTDKTGDSSISVISLQNRKTVIVPVWVAE